VVIEQGSHHLYVLYTATLTTWVGELLSVGILIASFHLQFVLISTVYLVQSEHLRLVVDIGGALRCTPCVAAKYSPAHLARSRVLVVRHKGRH